MKVSLVKLLVLLIFIFFLISCFNNADDDLADYYNFGSNYEFKTLINEKESLKNLNEIIAWSEDVKSLFLEYGKDKEIIHFFEDLIFDEKNEINKAFYYFFISDIYYQIDNEDVAIYYMLKVDEQFYDIQYNFNPVGYYIAKRIIKSDAKFKLKEKMYQLLLDKYQENIDIVYIRYELSNLYKSNLDMDKSVRILEEILRLNKSELSKIADINSINNEIYFYRSKKGWIYQNVEMLINKIDDAVKNKNSTLVYSLFSATKFDVKLSGKSYPSSWLQIHKRWTGRIDFSDKLEEYSNDKEAYLKTSNWNIIQFKTWYFYFKRVNYPYDKRVNGGWEWAGVFIGNPF